MLDKKQSWALFLFEFKMDHKTAATTHNINSAFGPGTANEGTVQWWFKKFCKGDQNLDNKEHSGWPYSSSHQKLTTTNWKQSSKLILLLLHRKLLKSSTSTILQSFGIWSKLERRKSSISGCLMGWPQIKKNYLFEVSSSHSTQQQWAISWLDSDVWQKVGFMWQPVMTSSVVGPRRSSKALPKAKLAPRNGRGHCLVVCCWSDPLQLSDPQ